MSRSAVPPTVVRCAGTGGGPHSTRQHEGHCGRQHSILSSRPRAVARRRLAGVGTMGGGLGRNREWLSRGGTGSEVQKIVE